METPQQLSHQAIEEFKMIYQEEFGRELSDEEIRKLAIYLLDFFGILLKSRSNKKQK